MVMIQAAMIVIVVVVVVPVIVTVVAIGVIGAVVIIFTAIYAPMNTPIMPIVCLRLVHGQ